MEGSEVVLLGWWPSMFGARVRIALAEKGIKYEYKEEDLPHNKSPLLQELNPVHKKIPVLIHHGKPICESQIIIEYIDESWKGEPPLLPSDPYLRSQARFWVDYIDKKIYEGAKKIWVSSKAKGDEEMQKGVQELVGWLKVLEGEVGEKAYFMGERFGYVDIVFMSYYNHFYSCEALGNFSVKKECPKLFDWATRCMERESVSKTLVDPNMIHHEATMPFRKNLGLQD